MNDIPDCARSMTKENEGNEGDELTIAYMCGYEDCRDKMRLQIRQIISMWRNEVAVMQHSARDKYSVCHDGEAIDLNEKAKYLMSKVTEIERIIGDG